MNDNFNEAIKQAAPGGPAIPVLNEDGKVVGYCGLEKAVGIGLPPPNPLNAFCRVYEAMEKQRAHS